jgi:hypothetical protein
LVGKIGCKRKNAEQSLRENKLVFVAETQSQKWRGENEKGSLTVKFFFFFSGGNQETDSKSASHCRRKSSFGIEQFQNDTES